MPDPSPPSSNGMSHDVLARTIDRPIGGQAVIEGVMIRSPERIATAVRRPDGTIAVRTVPYTSLTRRVRGLSTPIVRGVISFGEMLFIGLETLNYSASVAAGDDARAAEKPTQRSDWRGALVGWLSMAAAFLAAIGFFFFLPLAVSSAFGLAERAFAYNMVAGMLRVTMLLLYLWAIGRLPDIRRVFAYHGAEHQTIFAYEANETLTPEAARRYTRFHPRCGTSFILVVILLAVLTYALVDSAFLWVFERPQALFERFGVHIIFLPLVAGAAFEALKLSGKHRASPLVRFLTAPGLWLQHLTTRQPDDEQLAVAAAAARASLGMDPSEGTASVSAPDVAAEPQRS